MFVWFSSLLSFAKECEAGEGVRRHHTKIGDAETERLITGILRRQAAIAAIPFLAQALLLLLQEEESTGQQSVAFCAAELAVYR